MSVSIALYMGSKCTSSQVTNYHQLSALSAGKARHRSVRLVEGCLGHSRWNSVAEVVPRVHLEILNAAEGKTLAIKANTLMYDDYVCTLGMVDTSPHPSHVGMYRCSLPNNLMDQPCFRGPACSIAPEDCKHLDAFCVRQSRRPT